jgi:transcriptional regulator with XRE-family HTH domain
MLAIRIVGNQLKAARCLAGLSQADLADRTGLCVFSIRRYEQAADAVPRAMVSALTSVVDALEREGARFLPGGGVTLVRPRPPANETALEAVA